MIPIPNNVPIGAEWVTHCPRINGYVPGGAQPVQEVLWKQGTGGEQVVEWSYAVITPATLGQGSDPNNQIRDWVQNVVGYPSDHAGHIVGNKLGGLGTVKWNIFPQSAHFNTGVYNHDVEGIFRSVQERGLTAAVWFNFINFNDGAKPLRAELFRFLVVISDGTTLHNDLMNPK